ncbi:hypothetical protein T02_7248 [Trichinella nativa]|uniref:Uncharacterized protein n=1 Tax=Trichinella nativa TaxID=6335 RepID=A0A0V1KW79_9BILA|nr:hypothetical protein T06_10937 [Trichinella sp. T6]KRZ51361.1 hypothetical protein T02_7248 [Trichinella nativa]
MTIIQPEPKKVEQLDHFRSAVNVGKCTTNNSPGCFSTDQTIHDGDVSLTTSFKTLIIITKREQHFDYQ